MRHQIESWVSKSLRGSTRAVKLAMYHTMRGDHCQNSTLYKIIYSNRLMTGLQVRQQTMDL